MATSFGRKPPPVPGYSCWRFWPEGVEIPKPREGRATAVGMLGVHQRLKESSNILGRGPLV